jgi:hypothetical protein
MICFKVLPCDEPRKIMDIKRSTLRRVEMGDSIDKLMVEVFRVIVAVVVSIATDSDRYDSFSLSYCLVIVILKVL